MNTHEANFPLINLQATITSAHDGHNRRILADSYLRDGKPLWSFKLSSFSIAYVYFQNGSR